MRQVVAFSLQQRALVILLFVVFVAAGAFGFAKLNIEAYPDPVPPQVVIITQNPDDYMPDHVATSKLVFDAAFTATLPLLRTREPRARLRRVEHRGVLSTAMIYDGLPVLDLFRAAGPATLLGLMDTRGMPQPFFFLLERESGAT